MAHFDWLPATLTHIPAPTSAPALQVLPEPDATTRQDQVERLAAAMLATFREMAGDAADPTLFDDVLWELQALG